ncbi:MAG: hypothetical protein AAFX76_11020 [Planctomycetota bacterium]
MKDLFDKTVAVIKEDRRRAATVASLAAVGMLLWGRLLLKQVPQTASADGPDTALASGNAPSAARASGGTVTLDKPQPLTRDLFRLDPNRYSRTLSEEPLLNEAKLGQPSPDEVKRMAVVEAAAELRLQSVTLGEVPAAFINGRLVRVGGRVEGFELLHCDERSAVLEKDGVKVRLRL